MLSLSLKSNTLGPVKDIYFKIFKKGTCGVVGAVLGWPTLDYPVVPGGEGLGWVNKVDGAEFRALGVTLPRLDDQRKQIIMPRLRVMLPRRVN